MAGEKRRSQTDMSVAEEDAYKAGMELARNMSNSSSGEIQPAGDDPFNDPFFNSGQKVRRKKVKKSVHIISDTERIVSEETTYEDVYSFGQDIFDKD